MNVFVFLHDAKQENRHGATSEWHAKATCVTQIDGRELCAVAYAVKYQYAFVSYPVPSLASLQTADHTTPVGHKKRRGASKPSCFVGFVVLDCS